MAFSMKKIAMIAAACLALAANGGTIDRAAAMIKRSEGFRPSVYRCEAGRKTIGYGFTSAALVSKGTMTEAEASAELNKICGEIVKGLRADLGTSLKESEEAAIVSFIYNVGWGNYKASSLRRLLKEGRRGAIVGIEFRRWVYVRKGKSKVVCRGLAIRRAREARCFMCG